MAKQRNLSMLFRMCKAVNKPVLSMGAGVAQLAFYCATQARRFQVLNGKETGGPLKRIG